jgi:hypothetical protein
MFPQTREVSLPLTAPALEERLARRCPKCARSGSMLHSGGSFPLCPRGVF